ncbi:MAG: hypothetical protein NVSMB65_00180 [Chloroflexota bacterium]
MNKLALTALLPLAVVAFVALCVSSLGELLLYLHAAYYKTYQSSIAVAFALFFATAVLALATYYSARKPRASTKRRPSPIWGLLDRGMRRTGMMSPLASRIYDAVVSGFVATMAMALVLVAAYGIGGRIGSLDSGASFMARWLYHLTHNPVTQTANDTLLIAILVDLVVGLFWACVYVLNANPILHRPVWPVWIRNSGWRRGMVFALGPWALSVLVFLPLAGGGFLGFGLNAGPLPLIGNLVLHLVYGATLGGFHALEDEAEADEHIHLFEHGPVLEHGERGAALGIILGVIVGLVLGGLKGAVVVDGTVLAHPAEVMLALGAFLGAAGALIGSMAALHIAAQDDEPSPAPGMISSGPPDRPETVTP